MPQQIKNNGLKEIFFISRRNRGFNIEYLRYLNPKFQKWIPNINDATPIVSYEVATSIIKNYLKTGLYQIEKCFSHNVIADPFLPENISEESETSHKP